MVDMQSLHLIEFLPEDHELLEKATRLRADVWNMHVERGIFSENVWTDSHDSHAFQWGIIDQGCRMIAAARLCLHDSILEFPDYFPGNGLNLGFAAPIGMMSRLVVHPEYQRQGLASRLDLARIRKAESSGCRSIAIEVPSYRVRSLEKQGFEYVGRTVDTTNIRQVNMQFYLYRKEIISSGDRHE